MSKKLRPMKLDSGRVVCPVCSKELSRIGWYQHPCKRKHDLSHPKISDAQRYTPAPPVTERVLTSALTHHKTVKIALPSEMSQKDYELLFRYVGLIMEAEIDVDDNKSVMDYD